ncbi:hypothetical protein [Streptomyces sp. NPDC007264]|uniref:hypothetical protein n=1 Tax=Streptomyces sp. NPDC007264 TaxID=3364777 RepID=UPI0036D9EAA6
MGTTTVDEAGAADGAAANNDEKPEAATAPEAARGTEPGTGDGPDGAAEETAPKGPSGIGQGAGAVVSAGLGIVSLSGSWIGTVASAREALVGQLRTSSSASVARQVKVYGDAWHATAVWGGLFALAALTVGVVVLVRPAFGVPGEPQQPWIRSVAWGGVALGLVGLFLAVLKYTDILLGLPSAG